MKLGGWVRLGPGMNQLDFDTKRVLDLESVFPYAVMCNFAAHGFMQNIFHSCIMYRSVR